MVTTVTLNQCIDGTIEIEKFLYGGTNKVLQIRNDFSGKRKRYLQALSISGNAALWKG